jgi:RNA polymerase sigma-B factor
VKAATVARRRVQGPIPTRASGQLVGSPRPAGDKHKTRDEYARLVPLLAAYSELGPEASRRAGLRNRLVIGYLPVAQHLARRYTNRGVALEDLVQIATVGLIKSVDRYQPDRGNHFLTYAIPTITGEIRRYFRDHSSPIRVPRALQELHISISRVVPELTHELSRAPKPSEIAERLNISVDKVLAALQAAQTYHLDSLDEANSAKADGGVKLADLLGTLDPALALAELHHTLQPLLADLTDRQRTLLALRFFGDMTQSQIATHIGISQMQVSRLLSQILTHLRQQLEEDEPADDGPTGKFVDRGGRVAW